jgi:hypothetical protein
LYYELLPLAKISKPCLTIKQAADLSSSSVILNKGWGVRGDNEIALPNVSFEDSLFWGYMTTVIRDLDITLNTVEPETAMGFPYMDNSLLSKSSILRCVFDRITELYVSPQSGTFRSPDTGNSSIKNAVDHLVLSYIRSQSPSKYNNLELREDFFHIGHCRLSAPRGKTDPLGPVKHRLYWILKKELNPDDDVGVLFSTICLILKKIAIVCFLNSNYSLPQILFRTPSRKVLSSIRKGPKRTNGKQRNKNVLYYPFSFVKSKKFDFIAPSYRKSLSESSQKVSEMISQINPMPILAVNDKLPQFQHAIKLLYNISDDTRDCIIKTQSSPLPSDIHKAVMEIIGIVLDRNVKDLDLLDQVANRISKANRHPVPVTDVPAPH